MTEPTQKGCLGLCCAGFTLPETPEQVRRKNNVDGMFIADMLIPIESLEPGEWTADRAKAYGYRDWGEGANDAPIHVYRCKHHTPEGRCGVYERRPGMCSSFPYDMPCPFEGCTANRSTPGVESRWEASRRVGRFRKNTWHTSGWSRAARALRRAEQMRERRNRRAEREARQASLQNCHAPDEVCLAKELS